MEIQRADRFWDAVRDRARFSRCAHPHMTGWLASIALALVITPGARADNSYAVMLQNNAMWQANLTKQMINLGGAPTSGSGGAGSPAVCMPPFELQRGVDGHVPPELQGDPRYQAYLRCRQGAVAAPAADPNAAPVARKANASAVHLPLAATDFVPVRADRPFVDQAIAGMALTPEQRQQFRSGAEELFKLVAKKYRGNNLSVSVMVAYSAAQLTLNGSELNPQQTRAFVGEVNDKLARSAWFASLRPQDRQNESERLIFQGFVVAVLHELGARDPQARQQSVELARAIMKQFNGA